MKTLTVKKLQYELRAVFNEHFIAFSVVNLSANREVMSHSLRRPLAEKIPVQVSIKTYLMLQMGIVGNLLEGLSNETGSQIHSDLVWQDFMLETALSLAEQAIAYYGEE
jgi:hypothetical protein